MECCKDDCPSGRFSHLHRETLELCQGDDRVLGHLTDQGPSPPIAQLCRVVSSRKALGGSKLRDDGGHCVLQCCRSVLACFPRSVPRHNPVSELYRQFLPSHGLVFALTCTVNCGTLYRQVCAFPNHVQSIEITTGGLQSSSRKILRMINGKQDAPELNFESHSKRSEYSCTFLKTFLLCHYGIL